MTAHPDDTYECADVTPEFANVTPGSSRFDRMLMELLFAVSIVAAMVALIKPSMCSHNRTTSRCVLCINHAKNISLALHNYHYHHGVFPPVYTVDASGQPLHSWRTLLLPYLDQKPLYDSIDFSKPWDDPANAHARRAVARVFSCPSADIDPTHTTYLAVRAPDGFLRPGPPRDFADVTDGLEETLMFIDAPAQFAVEWMEPKDVDESALAAVKSAADWRHSAGAVIAYVDGRVRSLPLTELHTDLRRLVSINCETPVAPQETQSGEE